MLNRVRGKQKRGSYFFCHTYSTAESDQMQIRWWPYFFYHTYWTAESDQTQIRRWPYFSIIPTKLLNLIFFKCKQEWIYFFCHTYWTADSDQTQIRRWPYFSIIPTKLLNLIKKCKQEWSYFFCHSYWPESDHVLLNQIRCKQNGHTLTVTLWWHWAGLSLSLIHISEPTRPP